MKLDQDFDSKTILKIPRSTPKRQIKKYLKKKKQEFTERTIENKTIHNIFIHPHIKEHTKTTAK